eukprot:TRINITY_DN8730_c0_g1_i1.p1 TRINITY_DN8730_c0_g1~~TRINITY_DN8730_c0_g1_i1.p1  ORF type:complete len:455 (+),score=86.38 TRINITY_DN8730_c0_g1_i1:95-1459(+)
MLSRVLRCSRQATLCSQALSRFSLRRAFSSNLQDAEEETLSKSQSSKTTPKGRSIYLDMQATTPVDPRVLDKMLPYFVEQFGNPHSSSHHYGWETEASIDAARQHIADLINADGKEIIFTSGATECNNTAIKGISRFYFPKKKHLITVATEHKCVLKSAQAMQQEGVDVTYMPVQKDGLVDLKAFEAAIRPDTVMASIMAVNNEIGVIQPLEEIGRICRKHKIFFHTDAAQALGKIPIDVEKMNIDIMSMTAHKIYGPKGIGALYIRRRPRVRLAPILSGGGQERGIRSGTLSPPLAVGFGEAARVCKSEMEADRQHCVKLQHRLLDGITKQLPHVVVNGSLDKRWPGNLNLSFAAVEGESFIMALKNKVAVSSGSACTSASLEPSYVLRALGVEEDMAHTSIRFGLGRFTTEKEIDVVVDMVVKAVTHLRSISPLWEMIQEGVDLKSIQWTGH